VLKPANEIRFFVKLKFQSDAIILSVGIKYSVVTHFVTSLTYLTRKITICVTYGK